MVCILKLFFFFQKYNQTRYNIWLMFYNYNIQWALYKCMLKLRSNEYLKIERHENDNLWINGLYEWLIENPILHSINYQIKVLNGKYIMKRISKMDPIQYEQDKETMECLITFKIDRCYLNVYWSMYYFLFTCWIYEKFNAKNKW